VGPCPNIEPRSTADVTTDLQLSGTSLPGQRDTCADFAVRSGHANYDIAPDLVAVKRLARRAGIAKRISPHSLRHSFITAALDAGVPLRDVQEAASHADPRTTMRYDRARQSLDRHATYIVAAFVAGAAR
jgi:hypothetical protein